MLEKAMHRKVEAVAISLASGLDYAADELVSQCREGLLNAEELLGEIETCIDTIEHVLDHYRRETKEFYDELFGD